MSTQVVKVKTPIFKLIVAGEGGVGKTSIIHRYITGCITTPVMTVGSEFAYQELEVDFQKVGLSIWDFGGEERFRDLMPIFCLGAHGALLVFDLSRYSTFLQLGFWMEIIRESAGSIPVILVGAKSDLPGGPCEDDLHDFCQRHGIIAFFPVSANTGENIDQIFSYMATRLIKATDEGRITPAYSVR